MMEWYFNFLLPTTYLVLAIVIALYVKNEIKPKALILRKQNDAYYKIATVNLKDGEDTFTFNGKVYAVDWRNVAYHTKILGHHVPRFLYLENVLKPLSIHSGLEPSKDEAMMRKMYMLVKQKAIEQLVKASSTFMTNWAIIILLLILGIGLGFGMGWITYHYVNPIPINATGGA